MGRLHKIAFTAGLLPLIAAVFGAPSTNSFAAEKSISLVGIAGSDANRLAALILDRAYDQIGYKANISFLPGKRASLEAINGKFAGELARTEIYGRKHPALTRIPTPIFVVRGAAFAIEERVKLREAGDLAKYSIGVLRGIAYSDRLTKGLDRTYANNITQLFRMLERRRVDLVIVTDLSGETEIAANFQGAGIRMISDKLMVLPVYHYLHASFRHVVPEISGVLEQFEEQGKLAKLRAGFIKGNREQ